MLKVIISGVNGAMGQVVKNTAQSYEDITVVAGVDKFPSIKSNGFPVYENIFECSDRPDVVIDFSRPDALHANLSYALKNNCALVIATTGYSSEQLSDIRKASKDIPVFMTANMSLGVNLQMDLIKRAAEFLGKSYDIEIVESHHKKKVDAPSGTALMLANALNDVSLNPLEYTYERHSHNYPRGGNELGIHSIRGGTIVGTHEVLFIGDDETIEINHRALSKQIFASGAIRAARYIVEKQSGIYSMTDIISEQNTVTSIQIDEEQAIISIINLKHDPKLIYKLFDKMGKINIDMISQTAPKDSKIDISFSVGLRDVSDVLRIIKEFEEIKEKDVFADTAVTKITIEGFGMEYQSGVAAKVFFALNEIKIKLITTSETKIALCVARSDEKKSVKALEELFLNN